MAEGLEPSMQQQNQPGTPSGAPRNASIWVESIRQECCRNAAGWELINTTFLKPGNLFLLHGVSGSVLLNDLTMVFEILMHS